MEVALLPPIHGYYNSREIMWASSPRLCLETGAATLLESIQVWHFYLSLEDLFCVSHDICGGTVSKRCQLLYAISLCYPITRIVNCMDGRGQMRMMAQQLKGWRWGQGGKDWSGGCVVGWIWHRLSKMWLPVAPRLALEMTTGIPKCKRKGGRCKYPCKTKDSGNRAKVFA